jgi:hypothetical protein
VTIESNHRIESSIHPSKPTDLQNEHDLRQSSTMGFTETREAVTEWFNTTHARLTSGGGSSSSEPVVFSIVVLAPIWVVQGFLLLLMLPKLLLSLIFMPFVVSSFGELYVAPPFPLSSSPPCCYCCCRRSLFVLQHASSPFRAGMRYLPKDD